LGLKGSNPTAQAWVALLKAIFHAPTARRRSKPLSSDYFRSHFAQACCSAIACCCRHRRPVECLHGCGIVNCNMQEASSAAAVAAELERAAGLEPLENQVRCRAARRGRNPGPLCSRARLNARRADAGGRRIPREPRAAGAAGAAGGPQEHHDRRPRTQHPTRASRAGAPTFEPPAWPSPRRTVSSPSRNTRNTKTKPES
jgi:hypothetical protein